MFPRGLGVLLLPAPGIHDWRTMAEINKATLMLLIGKKKAEREQLKQRVSILDGSIDQLQSLIDDITAQEMAELFDQV